MESAADLRRQVICLRSGITYNIVVDVQLHAVEDKFLKRAIAEIEDVSASHLDVFFEMRLSMHLNSDICDDCSWIPQQKEFRTPT